MAPCRSPLVAHLGYSGVAKRIATASLSSPSSFLYSSAVCIPTASSLSRELSRLSSGPGSLQQREPVAMRKSLDQRLVIAMCAHRLYQARQPRPLSEIGRNSRSVEIRAEPHAALAQCLDQVSSWRSTGSIPAKVSPAVHAYAVAFSGHYKRSVHEITRRRTERVFADRIAHSPSGRLLSVS